MIIVFMHQAKTVYIQFGIILFITAHIGCFVLAGNRMTMICHLQHIAVTLINKRQGSLYSKTGILFTFPFHVLQLISLESKKSPFIYCATFIIVFNDSYFASAIIHIFKPVFVYDIL